MKEKSGELNFIGHRVRIRAEGFRPERLLNEAVREGMTIRRVIRTDETEVFFTLSFDDYRRLKKIAGSRYRLSVCREKGVAFFLSRLKKGRLLIVGIGIFLLFFFSQSLFIREVKVTGCRSIPEGEIREFLKEEQLYEGCLKRFNCDRIEEKLFAQFDKIVWARVGYDGNYAKVDIVEAKSPELPPDKPQYSCDIVAKKDCYIEKILPYKGEAMVSRGDYVKKGDILISGRVPYESTTYEPGTEGVQEYCVHAEGEVIAQIPYYFVFYMEPDGDYDLAQKMLEHWIRENLPEKTEILKKDLNFSKKKNIIKVYGTVTSIEEVGIEKEIMIDEAEREPEEGSDRR